MQWRVVDLNGKEILAPRNYKFRIDEQGCLMVDVNGEHAWTILDAYNLEFAFQKDSSGNWLYEHCVFSENN